MGNKRVSDLVVASSDVPAGEVCFVQPGRTDLIRGPNGDVHVLHHEPPQLVGKVVGVSWFDCEDQGFVFPFPTVCESWDCHRGGARAPLTTNARGFEECIRCRTSWGRRK